MRRALFAVVTASLLAACGGGGDGTTPPVNNPAITVSTSSSTAIAPQGSSPTVPITITRLHGATGPVTLTADGLPADVTASFTPNPIPNGSTTSTLTLSVGANAPVATSTITVRATAPGVAAQTATVSLVVTAATTPSYTLSTGSPQISANAGESFSIGVSITRISGFSGNVALALEGAPAGVSGTFSPNPATGASSTLAINTTAATAPGTYALTVRGTATGLADRTAGITLTVAMPSFALTATNVSVAQGGTGASAITITRTVGFTGAVTLSTANVPANVTVAYSQNPTTASAVTASFTAGAGATPGTYTVTLNGTGPGVATRSTTLTLTVTAGGGGGNFAWRFCDAARVPLWFSFRDGTGGNWTRVTASGANTFTFTLLQAVGAVAYVINDDGKTNAEVFYGSRNELQSSLTLECTDHPTAGKTLNGSVAGLSATETASIFHGAAEGSASFGATTYQLENVATGTLDLFGIRLNTTIGPPPSSTLNRMFLQRNVNVASGGTLPVVDFTGGSSFAPATAEIALANVGTDQVILASGIQLASGTEATYVPDLFATGTTRTFFGIPTAFLAAGDLHAALVVASSSNNAVAPPTQDQRLLFSYFRTVANRTLTLGPPLAAVTLSSSTSGGLARPKAKANFQAEYGDAFGVTFSQNSGARSVTISALRGYFTGGSEFELETPNFAGIDGFNTAWGLQVGVSTSAEVSAIGGLSGIINLPTDGTTWRVAARSTTFVP